MNQTILPNAFNLALTGKPVGISISLYINHLRIARIVQSIRVTAAGMFEDTVWWENLFSYMTPAFRGVMRFGTLTVGSQAQPGPEMPETIHRSMLSLVASIAYPHGTGDRKRAAYPFPLFPYRCPQYGHYSPWGWQKPPNPQSSYVCALDLHRR
jgi:hypothetical protein